VSSRQLQCQAGNRGRYKGNVKINGDSKTNGNSKAKKTKAARLNTKAAVAHFANCTKTSPFVCPATPFTKTYGSRSSHRSTTNCDVCRNAIPTRTNTGARYNPHRWLQFLAGSISGYSW
jgi:hypothetical protein